MVEQLELSRSRRYDPRSRRSRPGRPRVRKLPRALVLLKDRRTFEGAVHTEHGVVRLAGSERFLEGANYSQVRYGPPGRWAWPTSAMREVRYLKAAD